MANPAASVKIDWAANGNFTDTHDDVSSRLRGPAGTPLIDISRGANLDGDSVQPGTCTIRLSNTDNKYTPHNTSSPLSGQAVPGRAIRVDAVYNSTTYNLFDGVVRRIVPGGDYPVHVELQCEDAMFRFGRQQVSLSLRDDRSISDFRGAILDAMGEPAGRRVLATGGAEMHRPPTGAAQEYALNLLNALNGATRTIHFIRPAVLATRYQYVTKERNLLLATAIARTYTATEIGSITGVGITDEALINLQPVAAAPFIPAEEEEVLWERRRALEVAPGATKTLWARWDDPVILGTGQGRSRKYAQAVRYEADIIGTVTVTLTAFNTAAKLVFAGGASGGRVRNLTLYGYPATQDSAEAVEGFDTTSQTTYGVWAGDEVSSEYLASTVDAQGLADYQVVRFKDPRSRPTIALRDGLYPDVWQREPGDRIVAPHGRLGISLECIVEGIHLTMDSGGLWRLEMPSVTVPPVMNIVIIGGTAGQGVGAGAILGY